MKTIFYICACAFITFAYYSCKKSDPLSQSTTHGAQKVIRDFFEVPQNTTAEVKRIISKIRSLNPTQEYLLDFSRQNGLPVWNKVLASHAIQANNFSQNSPSGQSDTIIFIPIVLPDAVVVTRNETRDSLIVRDFPKKVVK